MKQMRYSKEELLKQLRRIPIKELRRREAEFDSKYGWMLYSCWAILSIIPIGIIYLLCHGY